jgi:two-component system heavy metal sensor histidine kinase CusS
MFLKTGQKTLNDSNKLFGFLATLSITKRLTVLYVVSAFILLATSAVFLDWVLVNDLEKEDHQFLALQTQNLRVLLQQNPENIPAWREELARETIASASAFIKYYVRILDDHGQTLVETPEIRELIPSSSFPTPLKIVDTVTKGLKNRGNDGRPLLLVSALIEPNRREGKKRIIQIALDMSHEENIISDYRKKMSIILFCGVFLSAIIGYAVAQEGLRPLKAMTMAFQGIGPKGLQKRIGSRQWPDEIAILADAFDKMLERLENSFTALSQFSADLAHELRTPINNLRGEAEVALFKARTEQEYRQVLESSLEEYQRLSRMIENLLFLAHADRKDTLMRRSLISVHKEIKALLEYYEAIAEEKRIKVIFNGTGALEADPVMFRQALSNVLSNAFQYTPEGGTITVTVKKLDNGSLCIDIVDSGIGIDAEDLPKILNRFYRSEQARIHYPQGAGLGFSIVKSIMDLHGGKVFIQSEPSRGTKVSLEFLQV